MTGITWTNMREVMDGMAARQKKLEDVPKLARQMGAIATAETKKLAPDPLHVQSGNWRKSIHAEVKEVGGCKWELWFGSRGAFSEDNGYNYGAKQERLYHPIEIGWNRAWPKMLDLWNEKMKGIVTANEFMSDFAEMDVGEMSW